MYRLHLHMLHICIYAHIPCIRCWQHTSELVACRSINRTDMVLDMVEIWGRCNPVLVWVDWHGWSRRIHIEWPIPWGGYAGAMANRKSSAENCSPFRLTLTLTLLAGAGGTMQRTV